MIMCKVINQVRIELIDLSMSLRVAIVFFLPRLIGCIEPSLTRCVFARKIGCNIFFRQAALLIDQLENLLPVSGYICQSVHEEDDELTEGVARP